MSWNYRVIKRKVGLKPNLEDSFQIHEVYYNDSGKPHLWSMEPIAPYGETLDELIDDLRKMSEGAWHKPVLIEDGDELKEVK